VPSIESPVIERDRRRGASPSKAAAASLMELTTQGQPATAIHRRTRTMAA
jgi:hypothetical protein